MELIDLDTETVREWADGDDWPPGFDLLWDETAKTWTARRWSSVAMVSVPASGIFKAFDAAHTLEERFESASPTASATGDILVRTTEQRFALVTHSGSSVSKPLIGRRRRTTSFVWYWLIEKPQATPALLPTQDSTTSPAATAPASTQP